MNSKLSKLLVSAGVVTLLSACGNSTPPGPNLITQAFDPYADNVAPVIAQWNQSANLRDPTQDNRWFGIKLTGVNAETYTATGRLANFESRTYATPQETREALAQACRTTGDRFDMTPGPNGEARGKYQTHRLADNKDMTCYYERSPAGYVHILILTTGNDRPIPTSNARPADYED